PVNTFFEELGERLAQAARGRGAEIQAPELSPTVAQELLELARVAAHTQERRFAPLASYLAGVAAERMRAAGGPADPAAVAAFVRDVREAIDPAPAAE